MLANRSDYLEIWKLGSPVLVTQLGTIMVAFADTMMVGAYGVDELASSAFVNSFFVIALVAQIGFSAGLTPLVGALYGRNDAHGVGRNLRAGLEVNLAVSLGITAVMAAIYFFVGKMGQPEELLSLIRQYYMIVMCSLLPMSVFNTYQQTAASTNDTAMPMWIILGANLMNVIGNYALIYGHFGMAELGLNGAGLSTLAARVAACVTIVAIMSTTKRYRPYSEGFHDRAPRGSLRRKVWLTSYPVMVQSAVECSLWTLGAVVCGWFGKLQLAAYQVVNTMGQLGFMTYMSFSTATSIKVSNYTGTGNGMMVRRITRAGLHMNLMLATLASLIFFFCGRPLIMLFNDNPGVVASAMGLVLPLMVYQYMDAIQLTYANALRGMSVVKPLLYVSVISYILLGVPTMWLFGEMLQWGNVGVYVSFVVALAAASLLLMWSYRRGLRRSFAAVPNN